MNKRQQRLERMTAVAQEYLAAKTAADLLTAQIDNDPGYGRKHGWEPRAGASFADKLEATFVIRIYAEFEAGIRDYWRTHLGQKTHPKMIQLVRHAIPNERFSRDCIDNADSVREYRNLLVHDIDDEPPEGFVAVAVLAAKKHLCAYFSRLDPGWQ